MIRDSISFSLFFRVSLSERKTQTLPFSSSASQRTTVVGIPPAQFPMVQSLTLGKSAATFFFFLLLRYDMNTKHSFDPDLTS